MKVDQTITEDEAALYDRQIRLWGIDAQRKLLASKILLINMRGLSAEIAKNLVLSGINCLTLLDDHDVEASDLKFNFLLSHESIGKNRAESCVENLQILNPMVKIMADNSKVEDKEDSYFNSANFNLVIALIEDNEQVKRINNICRKNNVMFLSGQVFGLFGFMFVDFGEFHYITEATKIEEAGEKKNPECCGDNKNKKDEKLALEEKTIIYKSYAEFLESYTKPLDTSSAKKIKRLPKAYFFIHLINLFCGSNKKSLVDLKEEDKDKLIELKKQLFEKHHIDDELLADSYIREFDFNELSAVNAILGGVIAQLAVKAISKKYEPINNFFVFDGDQMSGDVLTL